MEPLAGVHHFYGGIGLALGGFFLIWTPWPWLMVTGGLISLGGTLTMCLAAWRQHSTQTPSK